MIDDEVSRAGFVYKGRIIYRVCYTTDIGADMLRSSSWQPGCDGIPPCTEEVE